MQYKTFTSENRTVKIGSRTRRTALVEAKHRQILQTAFPEFVQYDQELYLIAVPQKPPKDKQTEVSLERFEKLYDEYILKVTALRGKYPLGAAYADRFGPFIPIVSRIVQIEGAGFTVGPDGVLEGEGVIKAFNEYLDVDPETDAGFWSDLASAVYEFDFPVTDVAVRPPETLTEDESKNPLSLP